MTYSTEIIRRVYDDTEGVFIQIGPDPDCPDYLFISVPDVKSQEWFGNLRLTGSKEFMSELGKALLEASK